MRIPSEFSDDNFYRRRLGRPPSAGRCASPTRRLVRLIVSLVLIVFLMRHASRPEIYEIFFAAPLTSVQINSANIKKNDSRLRDEPTVHAIPEAGLLPPAEDRVATFRSSMLRVIDGSVWRNADFDAFYAALAWPEVLARLPHSRTGVLPLLQQPDVYRGQRITAAGSIARYERVVASENVHHIDHYWQLWLRPADGSERPVLGVVAELPPELEQTLVSVMTVETIADGEVIPPSRAPRIEIEGVYLKRLTYASAAGPELAPVIVGRVSAMAVAAASPTDSTVAQTEDSWLDRRPGFVFVATALFGIVVAILLMRRSHAASLRLRALRDQQHPKRLPIWKRTENDPDDET